MGLSRSGKSSYVADLQVFLVEQHYVLIKNFDAFMSPITKHHGTKYWCKRCINHFSSENVLNKNKEDCIAINGMQAIKMPEEGKEMLSFNGYHKQLEIPFVIYADF